MIFSCDDGCDVGVDTGAPVSQDYQSRGNEFSGRVKGVQIAIAEAAEDADHLISPEEACALRWRGSRYQAGRGKAMRRASFIIVRTQGFRPNERRTRLCH